MDEKWIPLSVRMGGADARAEYLGLREEISPGLRFVIQEFLRAETSRRFTGGSGGWALDQFIWAKIQRKTDLPILPINSTEEIVNRAPIEVLTVLDAVLHSVEQPDRARVEDLHLAFEEARFEWGIRETAAGYYIARRLDPGIELAIESASRSPTAHDHIINALKLATGTHPQPAESVAATQKALESIVASRIAWAKKLRLGMVVGEVRAGRHQLKLALPRSAEADRNPNTPAVPPEVLPRAVLEAVHFGNLERHDTGSAAGAPQTQLTPSDAISLLVLASVAIDWIERGLLTSA